MSSREKHLQDLVRQGQALRQEDIDFGAKQERERIIGLLNTLRCPANGIEHDCTDDLAGYSVDDLIKLFKRENIDNSIIRTTADNVINDTESKSVARRKQIENGEQL